MQKSAPVYFIHRNKMLTVTKPEATRVDWQKNNLRDKANYVISKTKDAEIIDLLEKFESKPSKGNPHREALSKALEKHKNIVLEHTKSITFEEKFENVGSLVFEFDGRVIKDRDFEMMANIALNFGRSVKVSNKKAYTLKVVK
jgi:hypothetical protein